MGDYRDACACMKAETPCGICDDGEIMSNPDFLVSYEAGVIDMYRPCSELNLLGTMGFFDEGECANLANHQSECGCTSPELVECGICEDDEEIVNVDKLIM